MFLFIFLHLFFPHTESRPTYFLQLFRMLNLASIQSKKDKAKSEELDKFELYMKEKTKLLENEDIGKSLSEIQQQIKNHDKIRSVYNIQISSVDSCVLILFCLYVYSI